MDLYKIPAKPVADEYFEILLQKNGVLIEKIVSYGIPTPDSEWFDQTESEWVTVLEGFAELEYFNGEKITITKGGSIFITAHMKHRVSKVSNPCVWLAVKF